MIGRGRIRKSALAKASERKKQSGIPTYRVSAARAEKSGGLAVMTVLKVRPWRVTCNGIVVFACAPAASAKRCWGVSAPRLMRSPVCSGTAAEDPASTWTTLSLC